MGPLCMFLPPFPPITPAALVTVLLVLQDAPSSYRIILIPVLESVVFPRDSSSFDWTMTLENIWALGMPLLQNQLTARKCLCIYIYESIFDMSPSASVLHGTQVHIDI